jgi:hypothetical protein
MPIDRNTAQYITGNPQQPTQSSAPGIWDIDEQGSAQAAGRWPLPPNVVQRSLRFNSADTAYLNRTPATTSNRQVWTVSAWVKRSALGATQNIIRASDGATNDTLLRFESSDSIGVYTNGATNLNLITTAKYRDPSAWYHIVLAVDTTQATPGNRAFLYINGTQVTAFTTETYVTQNTNTQFNSTSFAMNIGRYSGGGGSEYLSAYLAEVNFVDGQALTPSSFGQTDAQTGQWIPRVYSGSYGTNGFRLQFLDNSGTTATTLGKDTSGLGNNWTPNNFSVAAGSGNDSLRDVPMNYYSPDNGLGGEVIGNYCTLNPLAGSTTGTITYSNGNLDFVLDRSVSNPWVTSTFAIPTSGKWYFEVSQTAANTGTTAYGYAGLIDLATLRSNATPTEVRSYIFSSGNKTTTYATSGSAYGSAVALGDVVGAAVDMDAGTIVFYKNGVSQGTAYTDLVTSGKTWGFSAFLGGNNTGTFWVNFGQRPFAYAAPSGFKCLCTQNLSAPRIGNVAVAQANDYFNTVLYTGNGASSRSITGVGFQPDFVWVKSRTNSSGFNILSDAVRGAGRWLSSNSTGAEGGPGEFITSFDSDGFSVNLTPNNTVNENGGSYVAWNWNAGGSTVTNTSGTITSSVRASQTAGFSVVSYTGTGANGTVGHGLSSAPQFLIVRNRDTVYNWRVWHTALSGTQLLYLNATDATATDATMWNSTIPTSSVFSVGTNGGVNESTKRIIAYCFAAVPGFSAFGSYTGNGSADGPFVYTGFKPKWIMIKPSSTTGNWTTIDTARDLYNLSNKTLYPDLTNAEETAYGPQLDVVSNGFKFRNGPGYQNNSGTTYIYAAFAEIPFQFANAR